MGHTANHQPFACDALAPEAALARRIKAGDAAAENELVVRYRGGLFAALRRRLRDASLAEDVCHEVFRLALPSLRQGRLKDEGKLGGYLWAIAHHLASRAANHSRKHYQLSPEAPVADLPARESGPDQQLLTAERKAMLERALETLSPRDREILQAFYLAETPKAAICRDTGLTSAQFDLVKWRALKRLMLAWQATAVQQGASAC